ncbi:5-formyltetrahydrofolate cyclo-ligase [Pseudokordiimonas caeni]|uniref:5-formyltetrahydrofolate cyclo-ligase n=1 Tax=Pseudokordiimonas caeni TaxID=2997908 RepID=UPI002812691D|nr:5-formyltetrahydrofolate cyclo-ligase [Pseudokordiimonas caeni]
MENADKTALRAEARRIRAGLAKMYGYAAAEAIVDHGLKFLMARPKGSVIAGYWPKGDELDPRLLMMALERAGFEIALPVVRGDDEPLTFRRFGEGDPLVEGPYGIMMPGGDAPVVTPSTLIVPLLSYDADCYRLGQGGGYYDRTLAAMPGASAFGFAYAGQFVNYIPREVHDMPLHGIITETGIYVPQRHNKT